LKKKYFILNCLLFLSIVICGFQVKAASNSQRTMTLTFSEPIINNTADSDVLKAAVTYSLNGVNYIPLGVGDTVSISGNTMTINCNHLLSGGTVKFKVAGGTVRDVAGNTNPECVSAPISYGTVITRSLTGVALDVQNSLLTGTTNEMEYSLNSTNGTDGTWVYCTENQTVVDYGSGATVWVRQVNLQTNTRFVAQVVTPPAPSAVASPLGGGSSTNITGLVVGEGYQYVVDSNPTPASVNWNSADTATADSSGKITIAPVSAGQYIHIRVAAKSTTLASIVLDILIIP